MCAPSQGVMLPYGLKIPSPYFPFGPSGSLSQVHLSALDFQRSQLNEYNVRVQLGLRNYQNSIGLSPFQAYINDPYTQAYFYKHDPRARFVQEEPKPSHSYIGLIGMAILNSKEKKLVLSDIYQWILDNYPYFRTRGPGWRNSIRHNLSLNDCFIKAGRSANGKGHYWAVHPANVEDFERGDFRRRRAQRKVRRHMGLSVPDDDDSPTPSPTQPWPHHDLTPEHDRAHLDATLPMNDPGMRQAAPGEADHLIMPHHRPTYGPMPGYLRKPKKRLFDMASLLAPDEDDEIDMGKDLHSPGSGPQGQLIPGYLHPMTHLTPHDLKVERSSLSSHSSDFSGPTPTQELAVDVGSCKDVAYDSDDDIDNDEIHVTSGENSPSRDVDDCDMDQDNLDNSDYSIRKKKEFPSHDLMTPRGYESTKTSSPCHPAAGAKPDNALDLTSQIPTSSNTDRKDVCLAKSEESLHFLSQTSAHNSGLKDKCKKNELSQRDGEAKGGSDQEASTTAHGHATEQSRHDGDKMGIMRHSYNINVKNTNGSAEDEQGFPPTHTEASSRDQARHTVETAHFYRPDIHDLKRQQSLRGYEANFNLQDANHVLDSDRGPVDVRRVVGDSTSPPSDVMRVSADTLRWADLTKPAGSGDRVSAFSSLGARNHNLYSPFQMQMRNFSLPHNRLLQSAVPIRGGVPQTLLPGAPVPHSMPLMKGMEPYTNSGVTTSNQPVPISNHNSTSRSGPRD